MAAENKKRRQVIITRMAANGIISYSRGHHPNEEILLLRGRATHDMITVDGLVIPPFAASGPYYSGFSDFFLPFDSSYVGTAHSHPGGSNRPSLEDLNRGFFGLVSIIIAYPYEDETMAAYDRSGNRLEMKIVGR
ncbi:MAG TPA: Mov34/MPN/PAD-1 family protein [Nitrososphaera sp.]|nr:Mov34/MPN/PAD-1 family protein [Nitrososphaera sp.]